MAIRTHTNDFTPDREGGIASLHVQADEVPSAGLVQSGLVQSVPTVIEPRVRNGVGSARWLDRELIKEWCGSVAVRLEMLDPEVAKEHNKGILHVDPIDPAGINVLKECYRKGFYQFPSGISPVHNVAAQLSTVLKRGNDWGEVGLETTARGGRIKLSNKVKEEADDAIVAVLCEALKQPLPEAGRCTEGEKIFESLRGAGFSPLLVVQMYSVLSKGQPDNPAVAQFSTSLCHALLGISAEDKERLIALEVAFNKVTKQR